MTRRLLTLLGITFLAFVVVRHAPGDPLAMQGDLVRGASLAQLREYRRLMGLDEPLLQGYGRWLWHLARGDLGASFRDGRPVLALLGEALPVTLLLSIPALLLGYLLAIPIGLLSAARPHGLLDRALAWVSFALYSLPIQLVALALLLTASDHGWPIQGLSDVRSVVLPIACLACGSLAVLSRHLRSSMLEQMDQDYVRTARSMGLSGRAVILKHALPNSLLSLIALFGLTLPALVSGAVIVERIFGLPGMGRLTFDAVLSRDLPVLMGVITLSGIVTMLGMVAGDALLATVDPRIGSGTVLRDSVGGQSR